MRGASACSSPPQMPMRVAMRTGLAMQACAIIGVRTSGMLMVVKVIPTSAYSLDVQRVQASSSAFDAT